MIYPTADGDYRINPPEVTITYSCYADCTLRYNPFGITQDAIYSIVFVFA